MANFNPVGPASPSTVNIQSKTSFVTTGATIGTTETTIVIPIGAKAFQLHTKQRSRAVLTVAESVGGTASSITSFDISPGSIWKEDLLSGTSAITIYIKSSKASTDVQLLYWL